MYKTGFRMFCILWNCCFYFIGGKTVMPFGVFEDRLIEGPLTEDVYEIDQWGAILGIAPDFYGLDISFSVYRSPNVIENLQDFDTHDFRPERQKEGKFRSYIANVTLEPINCRIQLFIFRFYEPLLFRRCHLHLRVPILKI